MRYDYVPDHHLEPPEEKRRAVYSCAICEESIYEGDDYYSIPELGVCCTSCIDDCKRYEAELDDDVDDTYNSMREEALL